METYLKPCPFCGTQIVCVMDSDIRIAPGHYVLCGNMDCQNAGPWDLGKSGAIEKWNARPAEDAMRAALEQVEWECDPIKGWYCPWCCHHIGYFNLTSQRKHYPDCARQKALGLDKSVV